MPEISLIIVNWNGKHLLEDCLGSLRRQTFRDFETILVDNGSSDGSCEYVRSCFPEVQRIELAENRGFAGGNLAGYERTRGDLIVLLNNDTEAHPQWLEELWMASQLFRNAGSFASKMMYFDDRNRIENCGFNLGIAGTTVELGRGEPDGELWGESREVFGACGGAVGYRRAMLEEIGFLDPDFFMVYEDVDLSFRAQLHGYRCRYVPNAIVYHRYRATLGATSERQVFYSQRNIEFVYFKNMPRGLMLRSAPARLLYEIGAALHFAEIGAGGAFLRSKLSVIPHLRSLFRKRQKVQRNKCLSDRRVLSLMTPTFPAKWKKLRATLRSAFSL
jgi:GT2 family glycosyltransferase